MLLGLVGREIDVKLGFINEADTANFENLPGYTGAGGSPQVNFATLPMVDLVASRVE